MPSHNKQQFLLFTTGGGSSDPLNWSRDEAALYPVSMFQGIRPDGPNTVVLYFGNDSGVSTVELKIINNTHVAVMTSIATAISNATKKIVIIRIVYINGLRSIFFVSIFLLSQG